MEEASADLEIKTIVLENIEDGNIGAFKDIFLLKDNIYSYSKYLGLEPDKIIDQFNEYLFEYTSKIPLEDIEKAMNEQQKEDIPEDKVVSPYTTGAKTGPSKIVVVLLVLIAILVVGVIFWAIRLATVNNVASNLINFVESTR
ncbi:MAG: helix-turn-helix domain-containing protein [Bacilli bacterium]|nr:helix-turn-helix domain-containing protein [Bacilli bacterium]